MWPGPRAPCGGTGRAGSCGGRSVSAGLKISSMGLPRRKKTWRLPARVRAFEAEDAAVEGLGGVEVGGVEGGFEDGGEARRFHSGFRG